jgi:hypothetical protein
MEFLVAHMVGDFLLQTDWMAKNKKRSFFACTIHVFLYMMPFLFLGLMWWQLLIIALQHWIQDKTTFVNWYMAKTGSVEFANPPFSPWSVFVVDATFHLLTIAIVVNLL